MRRLLFIYQPSSYDEKLQPTLLGPTLSKGYIHLDNFGVVSQDLPKTSFLISHCTGRGIMVIIQVTRCTTNIKRYMNKVSNMMSGQMQESLGRRKRFEFRT